MAVGYYDPNKDYSKAISEAKAAGKDTSQLEAERKNKIDDKYGGKEPNMIGSNQKFSDVYNGGTSSNHDTYSNNSTFNGITYTKQEGTGVYGVPTINSEQKNYKQGGVTYRVGADMSRRPDLAGKYAISNGYTVYYDDDGYAKNAVKGVVDYTPHQDINAGNGTYNSAGAWTDNEVLTEADRQKIADIRAQMQAGLITGDKANQMANQIRSGYGYTIDKAGNVTDLGAMSAVDARRQAWGLPINGVSAEMQNYLQLMEPEQQTTDPYALLASQYKLGNSKSGGNSNVDYGDAFQYIRDMYDANSASQLAALKSTYEQNVLDYQAQDDLISAEAQRQRNQAASQNDLQRMYMNEMGIMQGLNTGATGQMALAQSAALQGSFADIGTQEQQALAGSALERSKLKAQYSAAVDQAIAQNNYELANALYQEYVRQDNLAQQKAAAALEQQNWLAQFNYQKEQDALAQQNWQAQFDYQKAQDDLNYQLTLQKLYGANVGSTGSPVKTPSVGYNNGGLTSDQVKALQNYYGVTADGAWGKNSTNAAGGMTAAQAWEQFTAPVTDVSQLSANGIAVANSLARGYTTGTQQRDAIISAYQNGRITRGEAEFLARAVGASL